MLQSFTTARSLLLLKLTNFCTFPQVVKDIHTYIIKLFTPKVRMRIFHNV